MARGIEHREKETVLQAYKFGEKPNWALFAGTEPVDSYDGGDMTDGEQKLENYLTMIENSPTRTIYTLRLYNNTANNITNKTPYAGSTTLMLNQDAATTQDPKTGIMIMERGGGVGRTLPANNDALLQRLDRMEEANKELLNKLHSQEIKAMNEKLDRAISGLSENKPDPWEKIIEAITNKPEVIPDTIGKLYDIFSGKQKNYVHETGMAGTEKKADPPPQNTEEVITEEKELTEAEVDQLHDMQQDACDALEEKLGIDHFTNYLTSLHHLPDEQLAHWVRQQAALSSISQRLAPEVVTKMMETVAALNDKDLNKLLNHLD